MKALAWMTLALCGGALIPHASAQTDTQHGGHALGRVEFPVSCSKAARADFETAAALLHHMTYPQARAAFEALAAREPGCAMAHWGVAMTLFQPLWPTRPGPADMQRGIRAVQAARAAGAPTPRERMFVESAAAFFEGVPKLGYWDRVRRWERASAALHAAFPDDPEATMFYALSHLAIAPPDNTAKAHADRAAELLVPVHRANPDHPGAMHYLVHANDVPGRERELTEVVRKYETVAPRNPHALHMPTHIYTRIGEWPSVIRGNRKAAEAALEHPAGAQGELVWDEFAHAIEYLVYAHLQQGDDAAARAEMTRLQRTEKLEPTFKTAFHIASTAAREALERRDWAGAAALQARTPEALGWDRFPWPEAVTHFARALGAIHTGRLDAADASIARLAELEAAAAATGETLFTRNIKVLHLGSSAWLADARGQRDTALRLMTEAAELEASTPKHAVTPAPTLPAHELLGDLHAKHGRHADALAAYERSLVLYPNRFNSLSGAARAAAAVGDGARAEQHLAQLREVAIEGAPRLGDAPRPPFDRAGR